MTEYIEKKAAIDAVHDEFDECLVWDASGLETANVVENVLDTIPPADVRPVKRGRWKKNDNGTYSCERCHSWIPEEQWHYANWCLYCGADMREGDAK